MVNTQQSLENSVVNQVAHAYLSKAKSRNLEQAKFSTHTLKELIPHT